MDIESLQIFTEVAKQKSLTKASIVLSSPPSSISRKISLLESEYGGRLFHRTGRGVTLTEFGKLVLPKIKNILFDLEQLKKESIDYAGKPAGQVKIGILASLAYPVISRLFVELRKKHPEVKLYVLGGSNGKLDEWLAEGEIDIALFFRYGYQHMANEDPLGIVDTYLVSKANDSITKNSTIKFSLINDLPLILPGPPNGLRVVLDQLAKKYKINLNVVMETNSNPIQMDIVSRSNVYTVLAGYAADIGIKSGDVRISKIVQPNIERIITLGMSNKPTSLATREVSRMIKKIIFDMAGNLGLREFKNHAR
jgi:DNA-binding transcriptional LysR family regulator